MTTLTSPAELAAWIQAQTDNRITGIVGPPGSGKSTAAQELSKHLRLQHCVIPMDGFHYPQDTLRALGRRDRMGAPDTFDTEGLAHLLGAVQGRVGTVLFPDFDRTIEEPVPDSITVHPDDQVVILEGNYLLVDDENWARIGALLDLCVYVDIPHDVRRERLIRRHISFGKNAEHATEWVERVDEANARVIESTQARAHAIYRPET